MLFKTPEKKRFVEVFWTPFSQPHPNDLAMELLAVQPPKPFFPYLQQQRAGAQYLKCPAIAQSFQNTYVVFSPVDLVVAVNKEEHAVTTDRYGQDFHTATIANRWQETTVSNPYLLSLPPQYVFYSFDDVEMETCDLPIITSKSSSNFKIIQGGFNISKWMRPIELAVEIIDDTKPIEMFADDPLFSIRFTTPNNVPVKLTRVAYTQDIAKQTRACGTLKSLRPNLKLQKMYELAASSLDLFKRRNSK